MIVIPAIDLKGGKVVRLEQGVMDKEKVYSSDPVAVAKKWVGMGAEVIHVVDLEGAFEARPINDEAIASIRRAVDVRLELGGGIRDVETIARLAGLGIDDFILGTAARKSPELVKRACDLYPDRIIVGVDAREGKVAVEGWAEETDIEAVELAKRFEDVGIKSVIYTDIERDGMLTGVSIERLRYFAEHVNLPVIAAGGVSSLEDIRNILSLEHVGDPPDRRSAGSEIHRTGKKGIRGVITGKALYEGKLDLREAIEICRSKGAGVNDD
jgi:phosphoribosylformimino-5-aminoimidazole carboxamide ribotide isomerase